jgi:ribosomal protein S1
MNRVIVVFTLFLTLSLMAFAHGKEKHVMGTVTNISGNSITLETTAKKSVTVEVSDKTKFEKSGAAATLNDLQVGDKVVVHTEGSDSKLVASEVRFGAKAKQPMEGMKGMDGMGHK